MEIIIVKDYKELSKKASNIIASQMILNPRSVLGLATGSTPIGTYKELVRMNKEDIIDFSNIMTFNLDEYHGLDKYNNQSYFYFMENNLFSYVNIDSQNINIPDGKAENIDHECKSYEEKIKNAGGIDLQLLGIGRNGHIGFNEPDVKFEAFTHLVELDEDTIKANSRFFDSIEDVPTKAISMGIKTIMHSKKILLLASGEEKAKTVYDMVYGKITPELPASVLQLHPDVTIIVDEAAGSMIKNY
ncbi:glucosamine-6-phosphate deaminase [Oceanirhabdus seepicola]|uniref:Glucosamine-6-phosphate deaminase n=1 Tax=Oceanirhabdus seepicola TaxID=2828781 RepID=A0A9J6NWN1_9CLOT|nr:glucosamine-6-phosphate deaminase [Oceanirhabdus seepicola]MCM1988313.1 glucosamine-6-phosphate deaminase [Oceanirhabdus seepicola]